MVGNPRRRASKRNAERRRALELLAASPGGCTEAIVLAHGFTTDFLVDLIRAGLATARTERRGRRRTLDAGYPHADHRRRTTSARGASMAMILKRASQAAHPASGTMTITTCAATATITTEAQRMTTSRRGAGNPRGVSFLGPHGAMRLGSPSSLNADMEAESPALPSQYRRPA
jgi:hypothetical protein